MRYRLFLAYLAFRNPDLCYRFLRYRIYQDGKDLIEYITNIDPIETPFVLLAEKISTSALRHTWAMDELK